MSTPSLLDRVLDSIWGGVLGALIALGALTYFEDQIVWDFVLFGAGAGALLAFALGQQVIEWLKEAFARVW